MRRKCNIQNDKDIQEITHKGPSIKSSLFYDDVFMLHRQMNVLFHLLTTVEDFKRACIDIVLDAEEYEANLCIAYIKEKYNVDVYSVVIQKLERKNKKIKK